MLVVAGCHSLPSAHLVEPGRSFKYLDITKQQLIQRLGFPGEIQLPAYGMPDHEEWSYYYEMPSGEVRMAFFSFRAGHVVAVPYLSQGRWLSTNSDADFAKIVHYKRGLMDRMPH